MRGKFITFEGGEGSGKSTQARLLADRLRAAGSKVLQTREPGGSPFAEQVRALILDPATAAHSPLAQALLFSAARADHLAQTIRPALAAGSFVICDRFADSTRVYQGAAGGLDRATVDFLEGIVVGDAQPDLTLLLDIDPRIGLERARRRRIEVSGTTGGGIDSYEARELSFHEKLRSGLPGARGERAASCGRGRCRARIGGARR